jgi:antirestriction protein ArdC
MTLAVQEGYNVAEKRQSNIFQRVTDHILESIEKKPNAEWVRPWDDPSRSALPMNASTGLHYRGVNTLSLWCEAAMKGYESPYWATYRQWKELGAQVRKGEKATPVVFWKMDGGPEKEEAEEADQDQETTRRRVIAKGYWVFSAEQVDGWQAPELAKRPVETRIPEAEAFLFGLGADIRHGGGEAYYRPAGDHIQMPLFEHFRTPVDYYSTLSHELGHWSGAKHRLARDLAPRFREDAYAAEELVAELTAAFQMAKLGLCSTPRPDHAPYIAHYHRILGQDPKAIFTAAAKAQQAVDFLEREHERLVVSRGSEQPKGRAEGTRAAEAGPAQALAGAPANAPDPVCPDCKHVYPKGEAHACPTTEYLQARSAIMKSALAAEEVFTCEELEAAIRERTRGTEESLSPTTAQIDRKDAKAEAKTENVTVEAFIQRARVSVAYDEDAKRDFHRQGEAVLKKLAAALGYRPGDYDLRHNHAGIAVSGEITLHSDRLYVQFHQTTLGPDQGFLWRTCDGRNDYTGGPNLWAKWEELLDLPKLAHTMGSKLQKQHALWREETIYARLVRLLGEREKVRVEVDEHPPLTVVKDAESYYRCYLGADKTPDCEFHYYVNANMQLATPIYYGERGGRYLDPWEGWLVSTDTADEEIERLLEEQHAAFWRELDERGYFRGGQRAQEAEEAVATGRQPGHEPDAGLEKTMKDYERNLARLRELLPEGRDHISIENEPYMRLAVERIWENQISLCHYGEQNGDPMRDPEVVFLIEGNEAKPVYFRNDYLAIEHATVAGLFGDVPVKPQRQRDLDHFASMWFGNLHDQGFFKRAQELSDRQGRGAHAASGRVDGGNTKERGEPMSD